MKTFALAAAAFCALLFPACDHGRYVPAGKDAALLLDTKTGRLYRLPPVYRDGGDPAPAPVSKWQLTAEF
jgi:hypothetical protein